MEMNDLTFNIQLEEYLSQPLTLDIEHNYSVFKKENKIIGYIITYTLRMFAMFMYVSIFDIQLEEYLSQPVTLDIKHNYSVC